MTKILKKLWNGHYSLSKSYWFFGNIVPLIFFIILISLALLFQENALDALLNQQFVPKGLYERVILLFITFLFLIYSIISTVGIWRSANHYTGKRYWSVIAKFAIVLALFTYLKDIFKFFI